ncbi:PREDICTED: AN1-type zinc finger protein 4-like [Branchiostoma belcheri]|uniref:AN1-type zinc finger protein 4-like n=1 Tax=Branchiostoma belcheri TaxID=7741 RepID=A0A6P4Y708_BRABE|nr:PREDICTED: AN1-type zinc finger protein 4-like [Branchiostoma belcheri]
MDLFIETLTGTAFELRVSPFETVISVKAKIQRLEGIPISQQHLIWRSVELEDDYCLHDYSITDGSTLKLVLAMRGGPINTRRVPMEDPAIREMAEYMEANKEEILDKLPNNKQVTLLVFREGDQLNFFRVVDRGDGTLTPLSESLSGASVYNLYDEEEEEEQPSQEQIRDNNVTATKMRALRTKMESLSLSKKQPKFKPRPPSSGRPSSKTSSRRKKLHLRTSQNSGQALNRNMPLPPVGGSSVSQSDAEDAKSDPQKDAERTQKPTQYPSPRTRLEHLPSAKLKKPSAKLKSDQAAEPRSGSASAEGVKEDQSAVRARVTDYGAPSRLAEDSSSSRDTDSSSEEERHQQDSRAACATTVTSPRKRQELQRILEQKAETSSQGTDLPRDLTDGKVQKKEGLQGIEKEKKEVIQSLKKDFVGLEHRKAGTSAGFPSTVDSPFRRWEHGYVSAEARTVDLVNKVPVSLEKLGGRKEVQHLGSLVRSATKESLRGLSGKHRMPPEGLGYSSNAAGLRKHDRRIGTPDRSRLISAHSIRDLSGRISASGRGTVSPIHRLPPVKPPQLHTKKKSGKRCFLCGKKTGLATSYQCRCGNNFCATHRYAEAHDCTYDYKAAGRKYLEQANPVVSAPKLPKI